MMPAAAAESVLVSSTDPGESFLALLPAIQAHARAAFRSLRSAHDREDAEADVVARAWETFRSAATPLACTGDRLAAWAVAAVRTELNRPRG